MSDPSMNLEAHAKLMEIVDRLGAKIYESTTREDSESTALHSGMLIGELYKFLDEAELMVANGSAKTEPPKVPDSVVVPGEPGGTIWIRPDNYTTAIYGNYGTSPTFATASSSGSYSAELSASILAYERRKQDEAIRLANIRREAAERMEQMRRERAERELTASTSDVEKKSWVPAFLERLKKAESFGEKPKPEVT